MRELQGRAIIPQSVQGSGSASRSRARLHLGQAGPEGQVLSKWLKTTPSRDDQPSPAANPGALRAVFSGILPPTLG